MVGPKGSRGTALSLLERSLSVQIARRVGRVAVDLKRRVLAVAIQVTYCAHRKLDRFIIIVLAELVL